MKIKNKSLKNSQEREYLPPVPPTTSTPGPLYLPPGK